MGQKWTNKLTNEELELISGTYYPLLKKSAMEKVQAQLVILGEQLQQINLAEALGNVNGYKISRGENYQDLPYIVLDYPKISGEGFKMLCRVVFWWGKYVGLQFFLNQKYFQADELIEQSTEINDLYVLINDQIWNNDINHQSFQLLKTMTKEEKNALKTLPYLKFIQVQPIKKTVDLFEEVAGFYQLVLSLQGLTAQQGS
ncbi:MAG: hypothetical protein H7296_09985 [Bacteroidia bacterium]|nr:hypothetical protein [Bacteroidia bacterium]